MSAANPAHLFAIFIGSVVWAAAVYIWWMRFHGQLKADSWIGKNAPQAPGLISPLAVSLICCPLLLAQVLGVLSVNALSFASGSSFYVFAPVLAVYETVIFGSLIASIALGAVIPLLAAFVGADPRDVYFAGSRSLTASISGRSRRWKIHFHPGRGDTARSGDFFETEMNNFIREVERLGRWGPARIEMDSTLLAEEKYRAKQDRLLQRVAKQYGFKISSESRLLSRVQIALRKIQYPQLRKKMAGQDAVQSRKVVLSRRWPPSPSIP